MCRFAFVMLIYNIMPNASYIPKECEAALFKKTRLPLQGLFSPSKVFFTLSKPTPS